MGYIKFEHRHLGEDRWLSLSPAAFTVHAWALDHCNEQATDGAIPKFRADRLNCPARPTDIPACWAELVAAEVWTDDGPRYVCPEFTAHGIAADEQHATRQKWAEHKRRRRNHDNGNHQLCTPRSCRAKAAEVDERKSLNMSSSGQMDDPTRPDPNPKGWGSGATLGAEEGGADVAEEARIQIDPTGVHMFTPDDHGVTCEVCCLPEGHNRHRRNA